MSEHAASSDPTRSALDDARRRLLALLEARFDARADVEIPDSIRKLTKLSDPRLRRFRLVEMLAATSDRVGFAVLRWLWDGRRNPDPLGREMLLDLVTNRPLTDALGYDKVRALYAMTRAAGIPDVGRLFLSAPLPPTLAERRRRGRMQENEMMGDTELGRRKAFARGSDRFKLDRLLFDRNPTVIRNLLSNPRVVERDVVRVAAQRPTNPDNLVTVYRHPRWIGRYPVKKALAFNPYSPVDIALALMPHLLTQDLRDLSRSMVVGEEVRKAARGLLEDRRRS